MLWPVWILAILSIIGGVLWPGFFGVNNLDAFLRPVIHTLEHGEEALHTESWLQFVLIMVSVLIAATGLVIAYAMYLRKHEQKMPSWLRPVYATLYNKYWVDEAYYYVFIVPGKAVAQFLATIFDISILDGLINSIGKFFDSLSRLVRKTQTGFIRSYATWMMIGVVGIFIFWIFIGVK
jgi:NADH-quinone oxidoreductase subunit L